MCILEDVAREATEIGQVPARASVRLALGFLNYAAVLRSGRARPELYEGFWEELTLRSETDVRTSWGFGRWQHLNAYLNAIAREAGMERDHEYDAARHRLAEKMDSNGWTENIWEVAICNRKHQSEKAVQLWLDHNGVAIDADWTDRPHSQVFPTGKKTPRRGIVVRRQPEGNRPLIAQFMEWGWPTTVPGKKPGTKLVKYVTNARNLTSNFWRPALGNPSQRCLVPFTHFAEPHPERGRGDDGLPKQAWFCLPDQPVGVFAGFWRMTERGPAYAFATTEPNEIVAPLHDRMPAILKPGEWNQWLDGTAEEAAALVRPYDGPMDVQITTPRLSDGGALDIVEPA